jgi:hypothetical protein
MPCSYDEEDDAVRYSTSKTPPTLIELGSKGGVFMRATNHRSQRPYKRYLSPCKRQGDWPRIRHALERLQDESARRTDLEASEQAHFDASVMATRPSLLAVLRDKRGTQRSTCRLLADQIEGLDEQGMVCILAYMVNDRFVHARAIHDAVANHPSLKAAKEALVTLIDSVDTHRVSIDFVKGSDAECPGLSIRNENDERVDIITDDSFIPSQTLLVRVHELCGRGRSICLPLENWLFMIRSGDTFEWTGEWRSTRHEFVDGGRGTQVANVWKLFPANNGAMYVDPIHVPLVRLKRLLRA